MFSVKSLATLLTVGVLSAIAAPAAPSSDESTIVARQDTAVVFGCRGIRFSGECNTFYSPANSCFNVDNRWNDAISSIQVADKRRFKCTWFRDINCQGPSYGNQEDANLSDGNGAMNDRITSWLCVSK
ncbi:hypothetical protein C8A00DRAFT_32041 [Chaetomidium leptoderma]|uniref:Uncharacterized protein n=1 Tax=Chaetomidium leptoderma TaxID=669021 RepID=A0AAN6VP10_9PEZI|nr:hypothetical protein C8A00DRAFT_32041 [Chaetomidium leptoderma]